MDRDTQLAQATAAGDAAAFTELVRRHEGSVRRFLLRLSGHSADDLAQEVFIQAWRLSGSWRGTGTYRSWLMGIAWTQFLSSSRADKRRVTRESNWENVSVTFEQSARIDVQRALAELTEQERAGAILCFGEDFSHSEAAQIMGVPLGTLKSIVARARAKLAQRLEEADD